MQKDDFIYLIWDCSCASEPELWEAFSTMEKAKAYIKNAESSSEYMGGPFAIQKIRVN